MENHDGEHDEYDREDIEHVENMLYANIHYNSGASSPNTSNQNDSMPNTNSINAKEIELNRKNDGVRQRNTKRYWSDNNTPGTSKRSNFSQFHKGKPPSSHNKDTIKDKASDSPADKSMNVSPEMTTPKQFTPYVPFLQFNDSTSNTVDAQTPTAGADDGHGENVLNTTNEMVRMKLKNKKINPFSKSHMIDQFKSMFSDEASKSDANKVTNSNKRLNPFNALSKKAKRKKSDKNHHNQSKNTSKSLQNAIEPIGIASSSAEVINIDVVDDDSEEDVIILPTEAPPLICVDSSDDEMATGNAKEHAFTEPTAVTDSRRKQVRSPTSSIQSSDDFIAQNDQRNFGFDSFGTLSDEDLCQVSEDVVTNELHNKKKSASGSKSNERGSPKKNDSVIFTPPKQIQNERVKTIASSANKSYEVSANSFTAVDVYESESSDMPDSIYAKGIISKRKHVTDTDSSSSVESIAIAKSKRLRKRKCSGSAKESDVHSNDSSSDLPDDDDDDDDDDGNNDGNDGDAINVNSYLVPGEALGKIKSVNKKKKNTPKAKKSIEKRPQDDFMNKLTSLVEHDQQIESEDNDDLENTRDTSTESVAARDIVETVLQRRTRKSKKNQLTDIVATQTENNETTSWAVTDQVGETDNLNIAAIFEENDDKSNTDKDIIDDTAESNTNILEKSPQSEQLNCSNAANSEKSSNQSNQMNELIESNEDRDTANADGDANTNDIDVFGRELAWNDEMRRFYNDSWGGETFSLRNIRARMPRGFLNWMISNRDKSLLNTRRQIRCMNCQHYGHPAKQCPQPPAAKRCYMCGQEGHLQPRCPNKICYLCGEKSQRFTHGCPKCHRDRDRYCYECKQKGHRQSLCPDKWRRYHSTTTLDQPILTQETLNKPLKPKYCCLCAKKGHEAEHCNRANQVHGPFSVHVVNYTPMLRAPSNEVQNSTPKCTVLATHTSGYSFNFGNDVSYKGNSIYARFRRAVNLSDEPLNNSDDVMFISESNLHDTSEPPIEVYDDDFGSDADFDNISSTEHFLSDSVQDSSFMTIDNGLDLLEDSNPPEGKTMDAERRNMSHDNANELQDLNNKLQTLNDLKEKILSQTSNNANNQNSNQNEEYRDTNTNKFSRLNDASVTSTGALADFIPLSSNEPDKYEPIRSPSPISADSTTIAINEHTDATIHLTPDHSKKLVTEKGHQFLKDRSDHFNVTARLEWHNFGTVLIVSGTAAGQRDFHTELKEFFLANEPIKPNFCSLSNSLPKNRSALIKFIRGQLILLDSPICNKLMGDPMALHRRILISLQNPSKANMKKVSRLRKHLNMVLHGRYGFDDGEMHLNAVQNQLRDIMNMNAMVNVPQQVRKRLADHIDYIFSDIDHGNYEHTIKRYNNMKRNRSLPSINLDRRLLGLKINVSGNGVRNENSPAQRRQRQTTFTDKNENAFEHGHMNSNDNNRINALPSSVDIQINVSQPSTSHYNQSPTAQSVQRNRGFNSSLNKWNY